MKQNTLTQENDFFGKEKISRILIQIAPPVMLAQLIQALYNIVDSFFVGRYSANALTALSVIYPLQLIIVALAVGTGVGLNTYMAREYAQENSKAADAAAGTGTVLAFGTWAIFAAVSALIAILAAFAALDAAVPWIPDVVQEAHLLSVPIILTVQTGNKCGTCSNAGHRIFTDRLVAAVNILLERDGTACGRLCKNYWHCCSPAGQQSR